MRLIQRHCCGGGFMAVSIPWVYIIIAVVLVLGVLGMLALSMRKNNDRQR
jgi:hypothetical protein